MGKNKKLNVFLACIVLLICCFSVNALDCIHNDVIKLQVLDKIDFYCESDTLTNSNCVAMIFDANSMIYSFPTDDNIILDTYTLNNGIGKITFEVSVLSKYMESDKNFTYAVLCGNELWQNNILTEYKDYTHETVQFGVWMKNNINYIILSIGIIFVLLITIVLLWRVSR